MRLRMYPLLSLALTVAVATAGAQDSNGRGRKYKAPPATSHVEVLVLKNVGGTPIPNAAVIFHSVKDGHDEGNLEVKTNENGKAVIDVIPTGSSVEVQVIADGFATFADTYAVTDQSASLTIKMLRPRAQVSNYVDVQGRPSDRAVGVQEPHHPVTPPIVQPPQPTNHTSDPAPLAPVDPNATPGNSQNPTPADPKTPPPAPPAPPPPGAAQDGFAD